jgi:DNA-binding winged helix-turn-helix (wHTH) protein
MRVAFDRFVLDSASRELSAGGTPLHLSPKAFDLLALLIERRPAVVTKAEIQDLVWPDTFVEDANLSVLIADIRRVLEDDPRSPTFIRTVHGRGYAFCGKTTDPSGLAVPRGAAPSGRFWLVWREQTRPLADGLTVIGRDPGCEIWIDARGVSRRHARIAVTSGTATVEDLQSTNGTFVGRQKLSAPRELADGDTIGLGPETVTFRMWSEGPPPTEPVRRRRPKRHGRE